MKISISRLSKLVATSFTGLGIALIIAPSASLAQQNENVNVPSSYQNDVLDTKRGDSGSLYGTESGNFDPMSLIHRSQLGTLDWQGFSSQNRQQINSAAGSFRERQQKLLQQRQQQQPANNQFDFVFPVYTPAQATPASGN
ncbi:hypothetical protein Riv7116_6907 [Rivularia sp. PCC 7116]|uniref:hypothetical protein n=1 Tax=Rivularia sp. PCC 7116 TaxID=373994 RepID=UPI00029F2B70|nr:hypothetical protein [Rivularia sp. PCC 7116]AFY59220.1 hypothetical protein Riv7116_6907 [Rivularia sp. PCC 7116]